MYDVFIPIPESNDRPSELAMVDDTDRMMLGDIRAYRAFEGNRFGLHEGLYMVRLAIKDLDFDMSHASSPDPKKIALYVLGSIALVGVAAYGLWQLRKMISDTHDEQDTAEGIVEINGVKYYKYYGKKKGVYYLYPCDSVKDTPQGAFYDEATSKRLAEQEPVIHNNLWACVDAQGVLLGNVFCISEKMI